MVASTSHQVSTESLSQESDERLMVRYREEGNMAAFEMIVHRYEKPLYNFLFRYLGNQTQAEDVFQATFLRIHEKCHQFTPDRKLRPWIYSIATNLAIDAIRKERRSRAVSLDQEYAETDEDFDVRSLLSTLSSSRPSPIEQVEENERAQWTRRAVDALPDRLRVVLVLAYFQGLKFHEVAEILHIPLGTVKSRLHKALTLLHAKWKKEHGQGETT